MDEHQIYVCKALNDMKNITEKYYRSEVHKLIWSQQVHQTRKF